MTKAANEPKIARKPMSNLGRADRKVLFLDAGLSDRVSPCN
jgi:hypothetical protein